MPPVKEKQTYYSVVIGNDIHDITGRKLTGTGYIALCCKSHPFAGKNGYIFEHRVVVEMHIKRYLSPNEIVHHKNGIKHDNRIGNLEIMGHGYHTKVHHTGSKRPQKTREKLSQKARERWNTPNITREELIKEIESGKPVRQIFKKYSIHQSTFYKFLKQHDLYDWYKEKRGRVKK